MAQVHAAFGDTDMVSEDDYAHHLTRRGKPPPLRHLNYTKFLPILQVALFYCPVGGIFGCFYLVIIKRVGDDGFPSFVFTLFLTDFISLEVRMGIKNISCVTLCLLLVGLLVLICVLSNNAVYTKINLRQQDYNIKNIDFEFSGYYAHTGERILHSSHPLKYNGDNISCWIIKTNSTKWPNFMMIPFRYRILEPYLDCECIEF